METTIKKDSGTIEYFRALQQDLSERLANMTLEQKKEFLKQVLAGKVELPC